MNNDLSKLKVAIVCDWLTGIGGAERVVLELHKMFPKAPIYTSQYDSNKIDWFRNADVRTLWLQHLPKSLKKFLPPLRAIAFRQLNLSNYDLVISSSGAEAKAVKTGPKTIHICYCHSPTHYYWIKYDEYLENPGFGKLDFLARIGLKILVNPLKRLDYKAAQGPDVLIANSNYTKENILKFYKRDSTVIFPPVDIERFQSNSKPKRKGFLIVGRQTPHKRFNLVVKACTELNLQLTVVGNGPDHNKLKKIAGPTIKFIDTPSDLEIVEYFKNAVAFIKPDIDDFGIVAVEALAAGMPVIAYKVGGALDYIKDGKNGIFFTENNVESLISGIKTFEKTKFVNSTITESIKRFSSVAFEKTFLKLVEDLYSE